MAHLGQYKDKTCTDSSFKGQSAHSERERLNCIWILYYKEHNYYISMTISCFETHFIALLAVDKVDFYRLVQLSKEKLNKVKTP